MSAARTAKGKTGGKMHADEMNKLRDYAEAAAEFMDQDVEIIGPPESVTFLFYASPIRVLWLLDAYEAAVTEREVLETRGRR